MFIRDSASPNLPAMVKHLLFSSPGTFLPRGSPSWPLWDGTMTSCMTIAWTTATSSPMDWSLACVPRSRRDEIVECFRTHLMNSAHLMSSNVFLRSEPWTRCILHLSPPCTLIKQICLETQVSQYNSHFAMATLLMPHTSIHPRNNDCHLVWQT